MKKIICDTCIWYGLGNKSIVKPKGEKLVATWINIIELGFSHAELKELFDKEECVNAAKAIIEFADEIIEFDPFAYATSKIAPEFIIHSKSIEGILDEISENGLPDKKTYEENKSFYDYFMSLKNHFSETINSEKKHIRNEVRQSNESIEKFKSSDVSQIEEHVFGLLDDINNYLKNEYEKEIEFLDQNDIDNSIEKIKQLFECYIKTKQLFMKKFILMKAMKIEPNDFYDLLNLFYVTNDKLFWTKEIKWKAALHEAKMSNYLYEH